jgi:hypothetical protein
VERFSVQLAHGSWAPGCMRVLLIRVYSICITSTVLVGFSARSHPQMIGKIKFKWSSEFPTELGNAYCKYTLKTESVCPS